jgi:RHS repeat-associated protein
MGFRDYDPGLNRFLSRDSYNGALADLDLGLSPWTMNRYGFAGGNPVSLIELDGHIGGLPDEDLRELRKAGYTYVMGRGVVPLPVGGEKRGVKPPVLLGGISPQEAAGLQVNAAVLRKRGMGGFRARGPSQAAERKQDLPRLPVREQDDW